MHKRPLSHSHKSLHSQETIPISSHGHIFTTGHSHSRSGPHMTDLPLTRDHFQTQSMHPHHKLPSQDTSYWYPFFAEPLPSIPAIETNLYFACQAGKTKPYMYLRPPTNYSLKADYYIHSSSSQSVSLLCVTTPMGDDNFVRFCRHSASLN